MNVPTERYDALVAQIEREDSPVGIDAKHTHVLILHHLLELEARLERIERRLADIGR